VFGSVEALAGDYPAAEAALRHSCAASRQIGDTGYLSTTLAILADVVYEQGRYEEAVELSGESEELGAADDVMTQVYWRAARAKAFARLGRVDAGERLAREAVDRARATDDLNELAHVVGALAEVLDAAGRTEEAHEAWAEALELYERKGNVVMAGRTRDALAARA
jgi:tetratricopeptide (TPR) repeat protein